MAEGRVLIEAIDGKVVYRQDRKDPDKKTCRHQLLMQAMNSPS